MSMFAVGMKVEEVHALINITRRTELPDTLLKAWVYGKWMFGIPKRRRKGKCALPASLQYYYTCTDVSIKQPIVAIFNIDLPMGSQTSGTESHLGAQQWVLLTKYWTSSLYHHPPTLSAPVSPMRQCTSTNKHIETRHTHRWFAL